MTFERPLILELGIYDIYKGVDSISTGKHEMKISDFLALARFLPKLLTLSFLEFRVIFSKSLFRTFFGGVILRQKTELDMSESDYNWDASTSLEFWERFLRCIMTLVEEDQV